MLARKQPNVSAAEALCLNPMLQQTGQKNSTLMTHDFSYPWYTQANMALGSLAALRIDWRRTSLQHLRLQLRLLLQHLLLPRRLQKGHLLAWKVMLSRRAVGMVRSRVVFIKVEPKVSRKGDTQIGLPASATGIM